MRVPVWAMSANIRQMSITWSCSQLLPSCSMVTGYVRHKASTFKPSFLYKINAASRWSETLRAPPAEYDLCWPLGSAGGVLSARTDRYSIRVPTRSLSVKLLSVFTGAGELLKNGDYTWRGQHHAFYKLRVQRCSPGIQRPLERDGWHHVSPQHVLPPAPHAEERVLCQLPVPGGEDTSG